MICKWASRFANGLAAIYIWTEFTPQLEQGHGELLREPAHGNSLREPAQQIDGWGVVVDGSS